MQSENITISVEEASTPKETLKNLCIACRDMLYDKFIAEGLAVEKTEARIFNFPECTDAYIVRFIGETNGIGFLGEVNKNTNIPCLSFGKCSMGSFYGYTTTKLQSYTCSLTLIKEPSLFKGYLFESTSYTDVTFAGGFFEYGLQKNYGGQYSWCNIPTSVSIPASIDTNNCYLANDLVNGEISEKLFAYKCNPALGRMGIVRLGGIKYFAISENACLKLQ